MIVRQPPRTDGIARDLDLSRYDLYLALLPVPLLLGCLAAIVTPLSLPYGAGAGALPAAVLLGHGLFRDAPTGSVDSDPGDRRWGPADD